MKEQNKITEHLHARTFAHLNPCTHARLHTYTHTRLHALTLIELVIVCAIIAVLVGIVWVVMAPARERARQVVCISNLNLIGHAFRMYRDDWDGVEPQKGVRLEYWQVGLPPRKSSPNPCLTPYLKTRTVWICPSEFYPTFLKTSSYLPNYCTHQDVYLFGYQYDECLLAPGGVVSFSWAISHIPDWPILICETHHWLQDPDLYWTDMFLIILKLDDYKAQIIRTVEYGIRLPIYIRE